MTINGHKWPLLTVYPCIDGYLTTEMSEIIRKVQNRQKSTKPSEKYKPVRKVQNLFLMFSVQNPDEIHQFNGSFPSLAHGQTHPWPDTPMARQDPWPDKTHGQTRPDKTHGQTRPEPWPDQTRTMARPEPWPDQTMDHGQTRPWTMARPDQNMDHGDTWTTVTHGPR